jgi:hypothetical protein
VGDNSPFGLSYEVKHARASSVNVSDSRCPISFSMDHKATAVCAYPVCSDYRTRRMVSTESEARGDATHVELVILGWLEGAVLGEALDDLGCFVELCFRHGQKMGVCSRNSRWS